MGKRQILYLQTRYRYKLGWFFWFGPIYVMIGRNLADGTPCKGLKICQKFTDLREVWGGFEDESLCGSRIRARRTLPPEMSGEC